MKTILFITFFISHTVMADICSCISALEDIRDFTCKEEGLGQEINQTKCYNGKVFVIRDSGDIVVYSSKERLDLSGSEKLNCSKSRGNYDDYISPIATEVKALIDKLGREMADKNKKVMDYCKKQLTVKDLLQVQRNLIHCPGIAEQMNSLDGTDGTAPNKHNDFKNMFHIFQNNNEEPRNNSREIR